MMRILVVFLFLSYLFDMISTEFAIPDLLNESNILVSTFNLKTSHLWILSFFQFVICLGLVRLYFLFGKMSKVEISNKSVSYLLLNKEVWKRYVNHGFLCFCITFPLATIYFKFFAIIRNVLFGICRWNSFKNFPELQTFFNHVNNFIEVNYTSLSYFIFPNQKFELIYLVLIIIYLKKIAL